MNKVQCREVPDPKIEKDDDIIVKVTSTAICGSDLHLVHGLVKGMYDGFVLGCGPVGLLTIKWCILKGAKRVIAVDRVGYRLEHAKSYGAEVINFEQYDETGAYIKEITSGGADCVIDCVGIDGKMSFMEKVETALKLQGGSKSAIEIAS